MLNFFVVLYLEIEWTNLVNQVACAQSNLKRCTLELGGKSPLVVFDDVEDFEDAVKYFRDPFHMSFHSLVVSDNCNDFE